MNNQRKQYLIDRKFQLGQTFSVLGFMLIVFVIIISMIGINVAYNNKKMANITEDNDEIIRKLDNTMVTHDNILEAVLTWAQKPEKAPKSGVIREIAQKHYEELKAVKGNINTLKTNITTMENNIKFNNILILSIIIIVLVQGIILYIMMIRKTHKIAGPIYVMTNIIKDLLDGKEPAIRELREGDKLQEFYELLAKLAKSFKKEGY